MSDHTLAVGPVQIGHWFYGAHDAESPRWTSHHVTWYDNPVSRGLILIDSLMWLGDPSPPCWGRDLSDLTHWRAAGLTAASFCLWDCSNTHVDHIYSVWYLYQWISFELVIYFESRPIGPMSHRDELLGRLHWLSIGPINKSNQYIG